MADDTSLIGRIQNAFMSATNEVVVTAANINFDFSMVKYEAPPEYRGISEALTSTRRQQAEAGEIHITARRLGALFEGTCPPTPKLIATYGTRATEIARTAAHSKSLDASNWIFSAYTGIDATSLWAAATSKKAALPVHLLACLLARAWEEGEATSLWVELVTERRKEIVAELEAREEMPFAHMSAAAQADITREQLAKWDASARAWLRTADSVMNLQHKQLLLIIKNISLPVNEETITYRSIISAWTSALSTMEKVIEGGPHVVRDGAVLLALSSWHLYADMIVVGEPNGSTEVTMSDPLVRSSGILTLGFSGSGVHEKNGVYWSLSLAHHKFYGRPVTKTGHVDGLSTRLTFLEFQQTIIGAILSHWRIPVGDTAEALGFLLHLGRHMLRDCSPSDHGHRWIESLTVPIIEYFNDEANGTAAIMLGRRREILIPNNQDGNVDRHLFGLRDVPTLFKMIPDVRGCIEFIKRLTITVPGLRDREPVIAYLEQGNWHFEPLFELSSTMKQSQSKRPRKTRTRRGGSKSLFERQRTQLTRLHDAKRFAFYFGDADVAALFISETIPSPSSSISEISYSHIPPPSIKYSDLKWLMDHELLTPETLRRTIFDTHSSVIETLVQVALGTKLYSGLPEDGATISSQVLLSPFRPRALEPIRVSLHHNEQDERFDPHMTFHRNLKPDQYVKYSISLIAYFETGKDLLGGESSETFGRLLGACIGDSIYIPRKIILDPYDQAETSQRFTRLLGNIGKPGLTLLTCPRQPDSRDNATSNWRQCSAPYDGVPEDMFRQTTLHLSLTEWSSPLWGSSAVGERDSNGIHAEAVVSVRDAGRWVADIDPFRALQTEHITTLNSQQSCSHLKKVRGRPLPHMKTIATWDQVLDCDEGLIVVKAHNNWVGRLAVVSVLSHHCKLRQKRIVICPGSESVCWECVRLTSNLNLNQNQNLIFVY
ncbi:hypothetical protein QBC37DRAFT_133716 [Rhypophila decipiens]|uniref:Uncharacterized protein n=1 Tax=Rhypophila decipiens TaxID=261697 RepID=A0AAN7B106_9PEZI|nr:hypothetical protein QBC37DRAFT_133716 [Rhypophila decipiens]